MNKKSVWLFALAFQAMVTSSAMAALDPSIIVNFEEPGHLDIKSGVTSVRGWVVTPYVNFPIVRVDLYVNGTLFGSVPYGGDRPDVGAAYPSYPLSDASGFAMAYNFSELSYGSHSMTVVAVDSLGDYNQVSHSFNVVKFVNSPSFISNPDSIDFDTSQISLVKNSTNDPLDKRLWLENVDINGACYDIIFDWNGAIQGWRIEVINLIDYGTWCQ